MANEEPSMHFVAQPDQIENKTKNKKSIEMEEAMNSKQESKKKSKKKKKTQCAPEGESGDMDESVGIVVEKKMKKVKDMSEESKHVNEVETSSKPKKRRCVFT
jgi:hypothetical protein